MKKIQTINSYIGKTICLFLIVLFLTLTFSKTEVSASYVEKEQELRAVWVSPWGGDSDLVTYKSEESFKNNMTYILDTMEMYNLNTIVYHVRTHNNALYETDLNPVASYFSKVDFDTFDPLEWMIDECHKRGIEFHAWMNPYRVKSSASKSLEDIASDYASYPDNPASDASNMLLGESTTILNPGLANVRTFICDTVIDFLEHYDADAIHFDDYFYCDMGANGATSGTTTILDEPDQQTYEDYIDSHPTCTYSKTSATDKANYRREQVDLFIEELDQRMDEFNKKNNRYVELGIAPTGIYKNGDGKVTYSEDGTAITNGSKTGGQTHYSSHLFCDTVKWINEGWIDYIMPQSYWSFTHPSAGYENVMGWWSEVVKNKNVNLYSGIGLYMANSSGNTYGWKTDEAEFEKQLTFISNNSSIDGACIYNFNTFRKLRDGKDVQSAKAMTYALTSDCWQYVVSCPEIKSFEPVNPGTTGTITLTVGETNNTISFEKNDKAKFYLIYRASSSETLTYDKAQCIDIIGADKTSDTVTFNDEIKGDYIYGVRCLSYTNTLGEGISTADGEISDCYVYQTVDSVVEDLVNDYNKTKSTSLTVADFKALALNSSTGYKMFIATTSTPTFFSDDSNRIKWTWLLKYCQTKREEAGLDVTEYENAIKNGVVSSAANTINTELIAFIAGIKYASTVYQTSDYSMYNRSDYYSYSPVTKVKGNVYKVNFVDEDDTLIASETILEGENPVIPMVLEKEGYTFEKWNEEIGAINSDKTYKAIYKKNIIPLEEQVFTVKVENGKIDKKEGVKQIDDSTYEIKYGTIINVHALDTSKQYYSFNGFSLSENSFEMTIYDALTISCCGSDTLSTTSVLLTKCQNGFYLKALTNGIGDIKGLGLLYIKGDKDPRYNYSKRIVGEMARLEECFIEFTSEEDYTIVSFCVLEINGVDIIVYGEKIYTTLNNN